MNLLRHKLNQLPDVLFAYGRMVTAFSEIIPFVKLGGDGTGSMVEWLEMEF